jgi:hypothetical protein
MEELVIGQVLQAHARPVSVMAGHALTIWRGSKERGCTATRFETIPVDEKEEMLREE